MNTDKEYVESLAIGGLFGGGRTVGDGHAVGEGAPPSPPPLRTWRDGTMWDQFVTPAVGGRYGHSCNRCAHYVKPGTVYYTILVDTSAVLCDACYDTLPETHGV